MRRQYEHYDNKFDFLKEMDKFLKTCMDKTGNEKFQQPYSL